MSIYNSMAFSDRSCQLQNGVDLRTHLTALIAYRTGQSGRAEVFAALQYFERRLSVADVEPLFAHFRLVDSLEQYQIDSEAIGREFNMRLNYMLLTFQRRFPVEWTEAIAVISRG